jgi:hypothetical protein
MADEDRLKFRFNTDDGCDFSVLLTRRITLFILSAIAQLVKQKRETRHAGYIVKAINEFEANAAREHAQFGSPYDLGLKFPLGSEPLFVKNASCKIQEQNDQLIVYLELLLENDKVINLQLWGDVLQNLRLLLEQMVSNANWLSSPSSFSSGSLNQDATDDHTELKPLNIH